MDKRYPVILDRPQIESILAGKFVSIELDEYAKYFVGLGDPLVPAIMLRGYGHEYCADVTGSIWSKTSGVWKELTQRRTCVYYRVMFCKNSKEVTKTVHSLVCEAFYGPKPTANHEVRHLDGNEDHNTPDNLDWGTKKQNWMDRNFHGKAVHEKHCHAKLSMEKAAEIRTGGARRCDLARKFGVSPKTVEAVRKNETWKEYQTTDPPNFPRWIYPFTLQIVSAIPRQESCQIIMRVAA